MHSISLKAPAKLNISLDITGTTDDGYHLLNMITQTIDLFDYIDISKTNSKKIKIYNKGLQIPIGHENIIYKAVYQFFIYTNIPFDGVDIKISKHIPLQSGLGGGSSDAATTLIGLNQLFDAGLSLSQLQSIGLSLGADVPLFFQSGTCLCEGIGEIITPLPHLPLTYFVVVKPNIGFDTAQIYKKLDQTKILKHPNINKIIAAIIASDIQEICDNVYNVLEDAITDNVISDIKALLINQGSLASIMTGSGSAVFGIFEDKNKAKKATKMLKNLYPHVFLCTPYTNIII